ncbi:predicted membrane protein, partial [Paenibacillus popilliae ATCC 14706]
GHGFSPFNKGYEDYTTKCWDIVTLFSEHYTSAFAVSGGFVKSRSFERL